METNNHWEKKIINIYNDLNNFKKIQHQELFQNSFSLLQEADTVSAELNHILNNSKNNIDLKNNLLKVISNINTVLKIEHTIIQPVYFEKMKQDLSSIKIQIEEFVELLK